MTHRDLNQNDSDDSECFWSDILRQPAFRNPDAKETTLDKFYGTFRFKVILISE